jgi:hypothetical protein
MFKTAISGVALPIQTAAASAGEWASDKYKATLVFHGAPRIPDLQDFDCS